MAAETEPISRYYHWSERTVAKIAEEQSLDLARGSRTLALRPLPRNQAGIRRARHRDRVARRIRRALGDGVVEDFAAPPQGRGGGRVVYVAGVGQVYMGRFMTWSSKRYTAYVYTRTIADNGQRIDVCLFGSMNDFPERIRRADSPETGWMTPAARWIEQLLDTDGRANGRPGTPDDYEPIAVEALKVVQYQGFDTFAELHRGLPETRAFTLAHARPVEWFARIVVDVELTRHRWNVIELEDPDRILVGTPAWVRVPTDRPGALTLYTDEYRREGAQHLELRRRQLELGGHFAQWAGW
jgi:hypothetical protein